MRSYLFLLAGVVFWAMALFFSQFSFRLLGWEISELTEPIRNLAVPSALVGSLVFLYGLASILRKPKGGKTK